MLSDAYPVLVIGLITIFTDIYTFLHIKLSSKQDSTTYHEESHPLEYICKNCHTCCNVQSIYKQKLDIPFKSTFFSNLVIAYFFISFFLQNFVLTYSDVLLILFFLTLNIPLIVCWSRKNNFENMAAARRRNNSNAWNRTQNSEHYRHYQIMLAREQRNQAQEMSAPESFQHLHTNPVLFVTEPTPVL